MRAGPCIFPPMARLRDVPVVLRTVGVLAFAKRIWGRVSADNIFTWASALAYSYLFAVFPFFIFLLTLLPLLPFEAKKTADLQITNFLYATLGKETADQFWFNLQDILKGNVGGSTLRIVGLVTALWAAAGGLSTTISALDRCYELPMGASRPFWKQRLVAIAMTAVIVLLIISVIVLIPVGSIIKAWAMDANIPYVAEATGMVFLFDLVRWLLALLLMVTLLMILYHFGPNVHHRFRWVTPGAVFSIVMWILLGLGFRWYIETYGKYDKTYGSVAGVAIMLLVFYFDSVVLLIGAEINSEIDFEVLKVERGTRDLRPAEKKVDEPDETKGMLA